MALSPTTRVAIHFQAYGRLPKVLVLIFDDHLLYRNGKERIMVDSLSRKGRLSHRDGRTTRFCIRLRLGESFFSSGPLDYPTLLGLARLVGIGSRGLCFYCTATYWIALNRLSTTCLGGIHWNCNCEWKWVC
ncbi:hypothetical protein ACOSQ2_003176 [Xanthoceras sorbifolium]